MTLPYAPSKGSKPSVMAVMGILLGLLLLFSVAFGEPVTYNVSKTSCRENDILVLNCSADAIVAATIYGGHHMADDTTNCSYVQGDCLAPMKLVQEDAEHWDTCLWKTSMCRVESPGLFTFLEEPCINKRPIHYIAAVDFMCVPKNEVYSMSKTNTKTNSTSGYIITPRYPQVYPHLGQPQLVTVDGRAGYGVSLRAVHMNVRPKDANGLCSEYVEVTCSASGFNESYCGNDRWTVRPEQCSGDAVVSLITTTRRGLYAGFVVAFNYVETPNDTAEPEKPVETTTPYTNDGMTLIPWTTLTVTSLIIGLPVAQLA